MKSFIRRSTFAAALVLALGAPRVAHAADTPAAEISEEAKEHFRAGVALLQDPEGEKVEEAYREFKTAFDLSGSPKILGNMGFCAMRLERDGEAIEAYSRYLREVPNIDAEERAQIVRDLQTLQVGVVRLTLDFDKPGVTVLDERIPIRGARVTNAYGPVQGTKLEIGVRPGHHVVTAKLAGYEDAVWELEAYAGSRDQHAFVLREPPKPVPVAPVTAPVASGPGPGPWILMGGGAALLVAGTVTGVIALGKTNDIEDRCPNDVCPRSFDLEDERSSAKTFVRVTDALLIVGGLAVVGGAAWYLLGSGGSEKKAAAFRHPLQVRF
jgi:hypothetical protein